MGTASAIGTIRNDDTSSPGTGGDIITPTLHSISLSTSQLNIGSGQTSLVVTAHLSDDISGLSDGIGGSLVQVGFRSPSGQHVWGIFDIQHPLSGHQLDGTFQATVQLPANAEAGTWTVEWFLVADEAGNQKFLYPTDTPVLGSTTFQVSNGASDIITPTLHSISLKHEPAQHWKRPDVTGRHGASFGRHKRPLRRHWRVSGAGRLSQSERAHCVGEIFDISASACRVMNWMEHFRMTIQLPANAEAGIGLSNGSKLVTKRGT